MLILKDEFSNTTLDARLTKRLKKLAQSIAENPGLSINAACGSACESKAAYRFLQNQTVCPEVILKSHLERTLDRSHSYGDLLVIHDTTDLIYTGFRSITGLGELHKAEGYTSGVKGIMLHNSLLLTSSGVPLGLLKQSFFTHEDYRRGRDPKSINVSGANKNLPIEKKQSYRWIDHLLATDKCLKNQGLEAVHVSDRESDIYEYIQESDENDCQFVVRSHPNRRVAIDGGRKQTSTIQEKLDQSSPCAEILVKKEGKPINCVVKHVNVELSWPQRSLASQSKPLSNQEISVVEVQSKNFPKLHWRLLTNLEIEEVEDVLRVVDIYTKRWSIECFHRVLKSGFAVEKARLLNRSRIENLVTVLSIVSWHLFWLYNFGRSIPNANAETVFTEESIKVLKLSAKKLKVPIKGKFTVKKAIFITARLGGFIGRKSDGDPGMRSLWRGWSKLMERLTFLEEMGYG